jgi:DNA-directed RNA polymerase delta subunit
LKGKSNQVERILLENNRQMRLSDIAREIDRRLVAKGKDKVHLRTLTNHVGRDDRFITIGKSGFWGLKSWSHIDTRSILDLMERFLITLDRPATVDEIYNYVEARRPVSKDSISFYLSMKDTFRKVDRNRWGLSTWPEAQNEKIWTPAEVAEFVLSLFREKKTKELDYKILKEALMDAAKVGSKQAIGMLINSFVIETIKKSRGGPRYAVLRADYKSQIKNRRSPIQRKTLTIFEKVDDAVRKILESRPGKQIVLAELLSLLIDKYGFLDKTIYQYVSKLEYLEKVDIPGSKTKLCRLKDYQDFGFQKAETYSCFISYSSRNQAFAERLHADLENRGVECWFAPEDLKIGQQIREGIDESIRKHDRMLLVLSEMSVKSQWVQQEVETALEIEREQQGRQVLFPIQLDDSVMQQSTGWPAMIKNTRHIGDFQNWKDPDAYQKALDKLMRDLKAEQTTGSHI